MSSKSKYKISDCLYRCECGKEFSNHQSLNAHFRHCLIHKEATGQELILKHQPKGKMCGWSKFTDDDKKIFAKKAGNSLRNNIKNGKTTPTWKGKSLPEEMKNKIRKGRVKFLIENPGQHGAFDKSNKTYLENWFDEVLIKHDLYNQYNIKYNYSVYPYFLDFAFLDLKLDVEVDGKFHYMQEQNIEHDKKRNEYLINNGWKVFRISIDEVNKNADEIEKEFLDYLQKYNETSSNRFYTIC
jgi:very-short-patch-repair endonuclease